MKDNIQSIVVFSTMLLMVVFVLYFGLENDKRLPVEVVYTGDDEHDAKVFMESYYENMNRYGIDKTEKFMKDHFTEDYFNSLDIVESSKTLKSYKEMYGDDLVFKGEIIEIYDDNDLGAVYVGVYEDTFDGNKKIEEYGGVYILERDEDSNVFRIAYITGLVEKAHSSIDIQ